jgi:hypothetical protein
MATVTGSDYTDVAGEREDPLRVSLRNAAAGECVHGLPPAKPVLHTY